MQKILTASWGDAEYAEQIAKCLPDGSKPSAAHAVVEEMRKRGEDSVPKAVKNALFKAVALARK